MSDRLQMIASHLQRDLGLTPAQTAGVLGNFKRETGRDLATDRNEGGAMGLPTGRGGYGLAQWTGSRQQDLIRFAGSPQAAASLDTQLQFLSHELRGTERRALESLRQAQSPEEAAVVFDRDFERSGVKALDQRKAFARQAYEMLGTGAAPSSTTSSTPSPAPAGIPGMNLGQTGADLLRGVLAPMESTGNPLADVALEARRSGGFAAAAGLAPRPTRMANGLDFRQRLGGATRDDGGIGSIAETFLKSLDQTRGAGAGTPVQSLPPLGGRGGQLAVGRIARPEEDIFPTTGPHLDVRLQGPDGGYINPMTARSILQGLQVGGKPLFQQNNGEWVASYPITSGHGPRAAPAPGASTYHEGVDFGVEANTQLAWTGDGEYSFEGGIGRIRLPSGHTVKLLHTKPS